MSTEHSESAHSPVEITQQATTPTPTTKPATAKNPKRVAAGKMVAERTRLAREAQKKALDEAVAMIIANNKAKATTTAPEPAPTTEDESPKCSGRKNSSLSTTQWLAVGSLLVSLVGIYYKREELKAVFSKKTPEPARVEPQPARATQPKGLRQMD